MGKISLFFLPWTHLITLKLAFFLSETYLQGISTVSYVCHSIETLIWSVFVVSKPLERVEVEEKWCPEGEKFGSHCICDPKFSSYIFKETTVKVLINSNFAFAQFCVFALQNIRKVKGKKIERPKILGQWNNFLVSLFCHC